MSAATFIDRGGTFTDVVVVRDGRAQIHKVPSDLAVMGEIAVGELTFGTTVATNALLQRKIAPTLLVVTRGFADLPRIRDMRRPSLFEPDVCWPEPLCAAVLEVGGRISASGEEIEPLELPSPDVLAEVLRGMTSAAVVLMHSPLHPEHERRVGEALRAARPDLFVALGHRLCPSAGYLARIETSLVEAAVTPTLRAALARDKLPPGARAVRSDGSTVAAESLGAADAVLSGPASGLLAVAAVAEQAGLRRVIGIDMGGTSTDVCILDAAEPLPKRQTDAEVAGVFVRRPMLEVETIAAGGGSVLASDGVRLFVGPSSAGADPGPQCYGRGGPPTLTDAALAQGLIDKDAFDPPLDPSLVALPGPAEAFLDLARQQMADAIRRLAAARGLDPAEHAIVAFGGASGQHAAFVADRLSIRTVLVHPAASVLCAWGQQLARSEISSEVALWCPLRGSADRLVREVERLGRRLEAELPGSELRVVLGLRHQGTDSSIEVDYAAEEEMERAFSEHHRRRFGFDRDLPIEIVDLKVRAVSPRGEAASLPDASQMFSLPDGPLRGPCRIDAPTTSVVLPEGWSARCERGLLWLERRAGPARAEAVSGAHAISLWSSRMSRAASLAGEVLRRTARSVNIRERLDFSCAIFDDRGRLVESAPHVPVHLGAMGETVRDLLAAVPEPEPGQHWLTNDPSAGGSHLPDLTVISPVCWDSVRMFVASRAHHVDIGGITPGSMPPHSTSLAQEGAVLLRLPLLEGGLLRADLADHLPGVRQLETVARDLEAQIAANSTAARELMALGAGPVVASWSEALLDAADQGMGTLIETLPERASAEDHIAGVSLSLRLERSGADLLVDLSGTGGPHSGNLNAPRAVVRASVLFALVVLARHRGLMPLLNEGALRRVTISLPSPSIVDPPIGAAVAGGNVETSQRIADLILRAVGHSAASGGSMSNLTLGGPGWSLYETVGCGQGASPRGPGASGRQVGMTNTRATDPELLERRLPLRLVRFCLRSSSGGSGQYRGGDGLIREIELLTHGSAALLATRRDRGAPGLFGDLGAPGLDTVRLSGAHHPWDGLPVDLRPSDRVCVQTPGGGGWGFGTDSGGSAG